MNTEQNFSRKELESFIVKRNIREFEDGYECSCIFGWWRFAFAIIMFDVCIALMVCFDGGFFEVQFS